MATIPKAQRSRFTESVTKIKSNHSGMFRQKGIKPLMLKYLFLLQINIAIILEVVEEGAWDT